jgi:hypothetical protein
VSQSIRGTQPLLPRTNRYPYGTPENCTEPDGSCWARNNDYMGWHFQTLHADLSAASVTIEMQEAHTGRWVSPGPQRKPLFAPQVAVSGVGAGNTLVFGPTVEDGTGPAWRVQPGASYRVSIVVPTGGAANLKCQAELDHACAGARRASAGNCLVCIGTHQQAMQQANCSSMEIHAYCESRVPAAATVSYEFGVLDC